MTASLPSVRPSGDDPVDPPRTGFPKLPASLDGSFAPTWAPDGRRIAFETGRDDPSRGWVARIDWSQARPITKGGLFAGDAEWSPDGTLIALIGLRVTTGDADVYVVKPDGSGLRRLTRTKDREFSVAWLRQMPSG